MSLSSLLSRSNLFAALSQANGANNADNSGDETLNRGEQTSFPIYNPARRLRAILERHQGLVSLLQFFARAGVMFIPGTLQFYEVAVESCYSASQLIQFFNSVIMEDTITRSTVVEDYMVLVTRGISHIEVLTEKIALTLGGEFRRSQIIFLLELLKTLCRLIMLADRAKPTLLLHWGIFSDPDEIKLDLSHYVRWYTIPLRRGAQGAGRGSLQPKVAASASITDIMTADLEMDIAPSTAAAGQSVHAQALMTNARSFQGKRSGLVLNLNAINKGANVLSRAAPLPEVSRLDESNGMESSRASGLLSEKGETQGQGQGHDVTGGRTTFTTVKQGGGVPASNAELLDNTGAGNSTGAYDAAFETLPHSLSLSAPTAATEAPHVRFALSPRQEQEPSSASAPPPLLPGTTPASAPTSGALLPLTATPFKLEAKHCIYLGEILYTLRPAIYAWAMHQVMRMHGERDAAAAAVSGAGQADVVGGAFNSNAPAATAAAGTNADDQDHARWVPTEGNRERRVRTGTLWGRLSRHVQANLWPSSIIQTMRRSYAQTPAPTGGGYGRNIDTSIAAAVSMMIEVASIQLTTIGLRLAREEAARAGAPPEEGPGGHPNLHAFDKELQRRQLALLFYFLRSPLFDRATLPLLEIAASLVERIPLIGSLPVSAIGLLRYLNRTHFYTSASS